MMEDIKQLKAQIKLAQEWAVKHFNAENANRKGLIDPETLEFFPPAMFVEFPDVDKMIVTPSIMGIKSVFSVSYRLAFYPDGSMAWIGKHPIYDRNFPPLKVSTLGNPD